MKINKGDIFKIIGKKKTYFIQFILKDNLMGELIRVFPSAQKFDSEFKEAATSKELFYVFFPLLAAIKKKIAVKVGTGECPGEKKIPKYMKTPFGISAEGNVTSWSIFEVATGSQRVTQKLKKQEEGYSPYECWNDTQIIEAINTGWNPSNLKTFI